MLGFCKYTELPQLVIKFGHKRLNSWLYCAKIVVIEVLTFWRLCAKKGTTRVHKVATLFAAFLVDQKIFLLGTNGGDYTIHLCISEQTEYAKRLSVERINRAQKRCLFIQSDTRIGAESRRNTKHLIFYKCIRGRVPVGISACLKCGSDTAVREARSIGFTLYKLLAREFHNNPFTRRRNEAIVLFGGDTRHRLEPMGKVGCTLFDSPVLHRICNYVCILE